MKKLLTILFVSFIICNFSCGPRNYKECQEACGKLGVYHFDPHPAAGYCQCHISGYGN
jgi:hypothetical protein